MTKNVDRKILLLAACGLAAGVTSVASAQSLINVSGATLLENFLREPAATNDFIDVDGDGFNQTDRDQLAPTVDTSIAPGGRILGKSEPWWVVNYRQTGSVRGFQELVDFGRLFVDETTFPGQTGSTGIVSLGVASRARINRTQYHPGGADVIVNDGNPSGLVYRSVETNGALARDVTWSDPIAETPSAGGFRVDLAIVDVPATWATRGVNGTPNAILTPTLPGYGRNPLVAKNKDGSNATQNNLLADLGTANLNTGNPDANTIFDTQLFFAPIAGMVNFGTGYEQLKQSELRHGFAVGRLPSGENLVFVVRDSGSGTRNGWQNCLGADPSWGAGDNVGNLNAGENSGGILGPDFLPGNKNGNPDVEFAVINHRLAIGYAGAERALASPGWLNNGNAEALAIQYDLIGGTEYSRPNITEVLNNSKNGYISGGPAVFSHFGDRLAAPASKGGTSNGNPAIQNEEAAGMLNNIKISIDAVSDAPGDPNNPFSPGELAAIRFIPTSAQEWRLGGFIPLNITNDGANQTLKAYVEANNTLKNIPLTFGTKSTTGLVPKRKLGLTYSDNSGGDFYKAQNGSTLSYAAALNAVNRISGDFDGDNARTTNDLVELVAALETRGSWRTSEAVCPEIIGDFNGDGNFNLADARYAADGLYLRDDCSGNVNRLANFRDLDSSSASGNIFSTTLATGVSYTAGGSAGDVANSSGNVAPGWAPVGADGAVNAFDIDYVYDQFKNNVYVQDGAATWSDLAEAVGFDFSADIDGNLQVDQNDVGFLVTSILGTTFGDVNLDGVADAADRAIAVSNLNNNGGWAQGDVDGDAVVTQNDLDVIDGNVSIYCPIDFNGDGFATGDDFDAYVAAFEAGNCVADFNKDGFVTGDDFDAYAAAFELGC